MAAGRAGPKKAGPLSVVSALCTTVVKIQNPQFAFDYNISAIPVNKAHNLVFTVIIISMLTISYIVSSIFEIWGSLHLTTQCRLTYTCLLKVHLQLTCMSCLSNIYIFHTFLLLLKILAQLGSGNRLTTGRHHSHCIAAMFHQTFLPVQLTSRSINKP